MCLINRGLERARRCLPGDNDRAIADLVLRDLYGAGGALRQAGEPVDPNIIGAMPAMNAKNPRTSPAMIARGIPVSR
jgi:hypothetical protein